MRPKLLIFSLLLTFITTAIAQHPASETITLAADFYAAEDAAPVIMLLHMLNSNRGAWEATIPDLRAAGYALLNIDMRGHGASGGEREWDGAIADVVDGWVGWRAELFSAGKQ
jgi:alpha-beta hydrolase superfamily lysophospholipase